MCIAKGKYSKDTSVINVHIAFAHLALMVSFAIHIKNSKKGYIIIGIYHYHDLLSTIAGIYLSSFFLRRGIYLSSEPWKPVKQLLGKQ
jgi:hypothetical protein